MSSAADIVPAAEPARAPLRPGQAPRPAGPSGPLRLLLTAAVAVPLLVTAAGAWLSWQQAWTAAGREVEHAAEASAEYARRVLDALVLRLDRANDALAGLTDAQVSEREADLHAMLRRAAIAGRTGDGQREPYIFVYDREGRPLVAGSVFPVPRQQSFMQREFNQALRAPDAPALHVSPVYVGTVTGEPFFALTQRRTRTGNGLPAGTYDGVLNASIYVAEAEKALQRLAGPGDVLALVRTDGAVLARSVPVPPGTRLGQDSPMLVAMLRGDQRVFVAARSTLDTTARIAAYRRVEGYPVYTSAARSQAAVMRRWAVTVVPMLAAGIPATLALLGLTLVVRRGQRDLAAANAGLERRVAERTAALEASERRTAEVLDSIGEPLCSLDPKGRVVYASASALAFWQRPAEAVLGHRFDDLFPEEIGAEAWKAKRHGAETGEEIHPLHRVSAVAPLDRTRCPSPAGRGHHRCLPRRARPPGGGARTAAVRGGAARLRGMAAPGAGGGRHRRLGSRPRHGSPAMVGSQLPALGPGGRHAALPRPDLRAGPSGGSRARAGGDGACPHAARRPPAGTRVPHPSRLGRRPTHDPLLGRGNPGRRRAARSAHGRHAGRDRAACRAGGAARRRGAAGGRRPGRAAWRVGTPSADLERHLGRPRERDLRRADAGSLLPDLAEWRERVHPDDRAARLAAIEEAVAPGGPNSYSAEFRFRRDDGGWNWIAVHGTVVERDPLAGCGVRLAGVAQDLTERRSAEEALRISEERLRLAQEAGGVGSWEWNIDTGTLTGRRLLTGCTAPTRQCRPARRLARRHPSGRPAPRRCGAAGILRTTPRNGRRSSVHPPRRRRHALDRRRAAGAPPATDARLLGIAWT